MIFLVQLIGTGVGGGGAADERLPSGPLPLLPTFTTTTTDTKTLQHIVLEEDRTEQKSMSIIEESRRPTFSYENFLEIQSPNAQVVVGSS